MGYDESNMVLKTICPDNTMLFDDREKPSIFVWIPKFRMCDVLSTTDTTVHPAFRKNGVECDGFWIAKFPSVVYDGRAYSLPREDTTVYVSMDTTISQNRAKGGKFHEVTAAEWAAVALWCHKNGTEPRGNNNYGRDIDERIYKATPVGPLNGSGQTQRVLTGTGPVTWYHDGTLAGIWGMNGNTWIWCIGLRIVYGEVQVLIWNNAADPTANLAKTSPAWKALKANAQTWEELFVDPDGNGTTQGTVKLDYISGTWTYSTTIAHTTTANSTLFKNLACDSSIGTIAKTYLQAMAMMPDTALTGEGIDANYGNDNFYADNRGEEMCLHRGGHWHDASDAGVFNSSLFSVRGNSYNHVGGRSAFQD